MSKEMEVRLEERMAQKTEADLSKHSVDGGGNAYARGCIGPQKETLTLLMTPRRRFKKRPFGDGRGGYVHKILQDLEEDSTMLEGICRRVPGEVY